MVRERTNIAPIDKPIAIIKISLLSAKAPKTPSREKDASINSKYIKLIKLPERAKAFYHILENIPIVIRPDVLIVGSTTIHPRSAQTYPEFSFQWLEDEFDTIATRSADPFLISEEDKAVLREVHRYWRGTCDGRLRHGAGEGLWRDCRACQGEAEAKQCCGCGLLHSVKLLEGSDYQL